MDLLYTLAEWITRFMESAPPLGLDIVWILIAGIPATLLHELGHAVAARRLLGAEVEVSVGSAGKIAQLRLAGITATINALPHPARAAGFASFGDASARAIDVILIALAGPLASLCGVIVSIWLFSAAPLTGLAHDFLWGAVLAGFAGILALIPFTFEERRNGPQIRTDGRLALDALQVLRAVG